eukprot:TRINITY_DN37298_c0_g1_i1.p2 TRINITY_DN37298_c0_g1~~TRINITY_DN37298_c0_g1_i1.p2  ORF type:complete len:314 (+),score=65.23 TRINITY_DN37298_c0_g1_i1:132-1073(+)
MLGEDATWYSQVGTTAAAIGRKVKQSEPVKAMKGLRAHVYPVDRDSDGQEPAREWDVPEEPRQWRAFDFAEVMEQGVAPGLSAEHIRPPAEGEVRLVVERSPDRQSYVLQTKAGASLLLAREAGNGGRVFHLYVTRDGDPPSALGPAFSLQAVDEHKRHWVFSSLRCEECESQGRRKCGVRELARITHYTEAVGEGQAFCMDVELPQTHKAQNVARADVWCPVCGDCSVEDRCTELTSKRPKWSERRRDLTLDFGGRCSVASSKNFQLEAREKRGKTKLLYGKVDAHRFVLDYRNPFGAAQAFAAALTTSHWV